MPLVTLTIKPDPTANNPHPEAVEVNLPQLKAGEDVLVLAVLADGTLAFGRALSTEDRISVLNICGPDIGEAILDAALDFH